MPELMERSKIEGFALPRASILRFAAELSPGYPKLQVDDAELDAYAKFTSLVFAGARVEIVRGALLEL